MVDDVGVGGGVGCRIFMASGARSEIFFEMLLFVSRVLDAGFFWGDGVRLSFVQRERAGERERVDSTYLP